ncbi:type IV pilus secretin PilQ family protein [Luteimonas sp. SX5]|uniref:Type IV pilus secretin PilQ family protein n=2 Tax=Luteimonas galliterrae TaxID=2940486 RepID=A0ABT0MKL4_9GAMM|nr:type IV pilus secretin PilQ family protein [Luteimonas galliterrae]MCL1635418.1 type IV pilus secretin PilQ family protein [Luteimonas galliterrae]
MSAVDPATRVPGALEVSNIDFKRGDGGAGKLILRFSGDGAMPDLRKDGSDVIVDVGNASLPPALQKPLNVTDFATPVRQIDAQGNGKGTRLVLSTSGPYESLAYQTGRDYIVEVVPRASSQARGAVKSAIAAGQTAPAKAFTGAPVSFNFQDVPVRTVLQFIAEESKLNLVASDTVQGNITVRLINVPWDQALEIVMRAKGLDKRRDGNVIWVAPQAEIAKSEQDRENARIELENREDLETEFVRINYHNAVDIYKALTEAKGIGNSGQGGGGGSTNNNDSGFLSPRGRLVADARTNTLMISDIPKKIAAMKRVIYEIDRPVDQVLIEARIVIATDTFVRELGARFGVAGTKQYGGNQGVISGNLEDNTSIINDGEHIIPDGLNVNLPVTDPAGSIAYTLLGANFSIDLELSALQREGRGEVISNPRVLTSNQREAVIRQGQEVGYVTLTGVGTGGGQALPNVQFKDVLLELKVTPTITNDNRVFLALNVKKDEVVGTLDTSIGNVPQIAKREVNTAALVDDGQTVVIGGVYEFTDRNSVTKVPFLGDIPFLGNLFKKKSRTKDKAELLIFVTPKVLRVAQRPN